MSILFDYDPLTGVSQHFDFDPVTEQIRLTSSQDLSFLMEQLKQKRNNPEAWKKGIKESFAHYATIPPIIELELKKKGIDIYNPNQTKELLREINTNYPFLKVTTACHE
jgi:hypothetical protein